ncbi:MULTISPECIES: glycosyltransferase [unclassified Synechococcus]|uniref:glycosyltransferase n=1 Tax=unclassified Synechococcus TaxID=2626047 RepID=UPI0000698462|nr:MULTISPECIES: glycosyltransferase [unclassified Synechococcus]EAQ75822.1 Putative glycosyltransferase [Synechococcus sp. WH 5701]WFN59526.1 glycosyltransferase [Synechococcus sp. CCFWC 502]
MIRALAGQQGHHLLALGIEQLSEPIPKGVTYLRYGIRRASSTDLSPLVRDIETKTIRGEACAEAAHRLKEQGYRPDLICGHPGWGEMLFLRDLWPTVPILTYQEFFYRARGFDSDFDLELQGDLDWRTAARVRLKMANPLLHWETSSWSVTPTAFQRSSFPSLWQSRISVIHDGIDTQRARPNSEAGPLTLPDGTELCQGDPIVSFVNRRVEPYRGCHTMIRAIPSLQRLAPEARIVIVGETKGASYGSVCEEGEWKDRFLREIEGRYEPSRVHFTGRLPYSSFLHLLQLSAAHIYLTYPFVLSWSMLEAMACGCAVVGSATAPVQEVIDDGRNGLLVNFFDPDSLAEAVVELLQDRALARRLGEAARATVLSHYSLDRCLPRQLSLMALVASGAIGSTP